MWVKSRQTNLTEVSPRTYYDHLGDQVAYDHNLREVDWTRLSTEPNSFLVKLPVDYVMATITSHLDFAE